MFRKVRDKSIWAKGAIPPEEWKFRYLKRFALPLYDLIAIVVGALVVAFGLPTMESIFSSQLVDLLGYMIVVAGAVCLVGVSFPALWRMEVYGKGVLVGATISYSISLFALGIVGTVGADPDLVHQPGRFAAAAIVLLALPLPCYRMNLLANEARNRKNEE